MSCHRTPADLHPNTTFASQPYTMQMYSTEPQGQQETFTYKQHDPTEHNWCAKPNSAIARHKLWFPLTPDHELLVVKAHNVIRAVLTNTEILSFLPFGSIYSMRRSIRKTSIADTLPKYTGSLSILQSLPSSLAPTSLQLQVPHLPWIDIIPAPIFRDNLIKHMWLRPTCCTEIVQDLVGDLFTFGAGVNLPSVAKSGIDVTQDHIASKHAPQELGIISWSTPWDINGWEFSASFVRKWGFLLDGCKDILNSTNRWRSLRGEDELTLWTDVSGSSRQVQVSDDRTRIYEPHSHI